MSESTELFSMVFLLYKIVVKLEAFNAFEAADRKTKVLARDSGVHVNVV